MPNSPLNLHTNEIRYGSDEKVKYQTREFFNRELNSSKWYSNSSGGNNNYTMIT